MHIRDHEEKLQLATSIPEPTDVTVMTYGQLRDRAKTGDWIECAHIIGLDAEIYVWCVETAYAVASVSLHSWPFQPDEGSTDVIWFEDYADWSKAFRAALDCAATITVAETKLALG